MNVKAVRVEAGNYTLRTEAGTYAGNVRKHRNGWRMELAYRNGDFQTRTLKEAVSLAQEAADNVGDLEGHLSSLARAEDSAAADVKPGDMVVAGKHLLPVAKVHSEDNGAKTVVTVKDGRGFVRYSDDIVRVVRADESADEAQAQESADEIESADEEAPASPVTEEASSESAVLAEAGVPTTGTTEEIDLHPYRAVVDVITGTGVLVSPPASEDIRLSDGGASLHDSLLSDALRQLARHGVDGLEGDDGALMVEGTTEDGRTVYSLYVLDPVRAEPSLEEINASIRALRRSAGVLSR